MRSCWRSISKCENQVSVSKNIAVPIGPECRIIGAEPERGNLTRREIGETSASYAGQGVT
jgi:hypothetical protein